MKPNSWCPPPTHTHTQNLSFCEFTSPSRLRNFSSKLGNLSNPTLGFNRYACFPDSVFQAEYTSEQKEPGSLSKYVINPQLPSAFCGLVLPNHPPLATAGVTQR